MVRIAAVGDLHYSKTTQGSWQPMFAQIGQAADLLLLCGDLTDYGLVEEAQGLARELTAAIKIPIVAVLGNHDYEAGREGDIRAVLTQANVNVLDGDTCEVLGIGFAGAKGFAGGFGRGPALGRIHGQAVRAGSDQRGAEARSALARLRTPHRIALLHYSPISATVDGEPRRSFRILARADSKSRSTDSP